MTSPSVHPGRAVPLLAIVLLAVAIHGPLLLMQLPVFSFDAYTHMFFSAHYAGHWWNPWNEKWFAGFSQTTYPPLAHQWIALFSHLLGLRLAYMFVQLLVIMLLPVGMYRYARIWVDERSSTYAAMGSVFLGSLAMLVYQAGQLPTTFAAVLTLNAMPYFYRWMTRGSGQALIKGVLLVAVTAAAHHVTVLFGMGLFALPVLWLALMERHEASQQSSSRAILSRAVIFGAVALVLVGFVLLPYFVQLGQNPIRQMPIPHESRDNFIQHPDSGLNFWVIPHGALLLALPFMFWRGGSDRRLRPLFIFWFITLLLSLGGTTPAGRWLLPGRLWYVLTYERYTFWATLLMLPVVGILAFELMQRYQRKAIVSLWIAAVASFALAVSWTVYRPINPDVFNVDEVISFLNRDDHAKFRYITLGFGYQFSRVATESQAATIDGDYNAARMLPEMNAYGTGKLDNAKYFGTGGMEALRAMLKHADKYGLKYVFVRDRYFEPLLAFAGWRMVEVYDHGNITLWSKEDVPPAHKIESNLAPTLWQRVHWGTVPILSSLLAILLALLLPDERGAAQTVPFPAAAAAEPVFLREAK